MSSDNFFQNILENMADGVMALDFKGRIIMFNAAAGNILGLEPDKVQSHAFASVFMTGSEDNDEFNQMILDAVYERGVGLTSIIDYTRDDGKKVSISVRSSYLGSGGDNRDGKGVILVFSDITQLKTLQARQEEDARKLGKAYQDLEEKNDQLQKALKRVQVVRIVSTILIIGLFLGLGGYYFQGETLLKTVQQARTADSSGVERTTQYITVDSSPLSSTVSLTGRLEPLEEIVITAPFEGTIEERYFSFGQVVEKGDLLLVLDSSDLEIKLRSARSDYIKARQRYRELMNWESGTEMTRARRSLARARDTLEVNTRKMEEARLLFDRGVIPAQEFESAQRQVETALVDVQSAEEELDSVREKANQENIELVEMDLENARVNLKNLEQQMEQKEIKAPVSGVVIQSVTSDDKKVSLERGARVSAGLSLFAVGDLSGMNVSTKVDEVDVRKIAPGQPVRARGDAFPDVFLEGVVSHISAQAMPGSGRQGSTFEVKVTFPDMDKHSLEIIRVGMSSDLEIMVYENPEALMVPLSFVRVSRGMGLVRLVQQDGSIGEVQVETGITTLRSVQITSGLNPGDRLAGW